jgi:hypothetical protein
MFTDVSEDHAVSNFRVQEEAESVESLVRIYGEGSPG